MKVKINVVIISIVIISGTVLLNNLKGKVVQPVSNFDIKLYTGKWYEIARLDHFFERGLSNVIAEYKLEDDGKISVINRGYSMKKNKLKLANGKAYLEKEKNIGHLRVSFFGPFYSHYIIFELDDAYQYAFVADKKAKYLWLLSRTPQVSDKVKELFISQIETFEIDSSLLIWVDQTDNILEI